MSHIEGPPAKRFRLRVVFLVVLALRGAIVLGGPFAPRLTRRAVVRARALVAPEPRGGRQPCFAVSPVSSFGRASAASSRSSFCVHGRRDRCCARRSARRSRPYLPQLRGRRTRRPGARQASAPRHALHGQDRDRTARLMCAARGVNAGKATCRPITRTRDDAQRLTALAAPDAEERLALAELHLRGRLHPARARWWISSGLALALAAVLIRGGHLRRRARAPKGGPAALAQGALRRSVPQVKRNRKRFAQAATCTGLPR